MFGIDVPCLVVFSFVFNGIMAFYSFWYREQVGVIVGVDVNFGSPSPVKVVIFRLKVALILDDMKRKVFVAIIKYCPCETAIGNQTTQPQFMFLFVGKGRVE